MTSTEPGAYGIREAFRRFFPGFLARHPGLGPERRRVAACIMGCKTGDFGYNVSVCGECGTPVVHASSCNNRSCPCCQAPLAKKWEMERNTELVEGISYYHVVFTVPHELNGLLRANEAALFGLMFRCVHETLLALCADQRFMGAKPGIVSVLHTWGQTLSFHPHVHVCVSGGGITPAGKFVETSHKGFFLPVAAIASMFRGKFLSALKKLHDGGRLDLSRTEELRDSEGWKSFVDALYGKAWLPFVKETFNGRGNAIRYLARYSYRTAIANSRIVSVDDETVTFRYKDYADGGANKEMTVGGEDFVGLYLQHVLPAGFHRFRSAGYLANCKKTANLNLIHRLRNTVYGGNPYREMTTAELLMELYGRDVCACPRCSGRLVPLARGMPLAVMPPKVRALVADVI